MFKLYFIEDVVVLNVSEYFGDKDNIIFQKLSKKFIDKVIKGIGLSISLDQDFIKSESKIIPNEGSAHFKIQFKLLVFSPGINDIFKATVESINNKSIQLSTGFFNDILVIPEILPNNYIYDDNTITWYSINNDEKIAIKKGDDVLFQVLDVIFNPDKEDPSTLPDPKLLPVLLIIGTLIDKNDNKLK